MAEIATGISEIGGAIADLYGSKGSTASATSYGQAATIAEQNAQITKEQTAIQEAMASRTIYQTLGKQAAEVGGAGFAAKGTAIDLLRSSASQGALDKAMIAEQGAIQENSYAEQSGLYAGLARSATSAGTGQTIGGVIQGSGGLISLASNAYKGYQFLTAPSALALGTDAAALAAGAEAGAGIGAGVAGASFTGGAVAATAVEEGAALGVGDLIATAAAWIVCTELHRQGRMPSRYYYSAASTFLAYPERGKRGYYVWAIPSTKHLRAHPESLYSRLLAWAFNERARYITWRLRGRPTTLTGAAVTHGLYAFCWTLSWFVPARFAQWKAVYG